MQRNNPRLYELNIGFISPFDKKIVEKRVKVSPFVHLETKKNADDIQCYIIDDHSQKKHWLSSHSSAIIGLLRLFKNWTVPDEIFTQENAEQAYDGLLYCYNAGFLFTETYELTYDVLSQKLLNYRREIDEVCIYYHCPDIQATMFQKLKNKVKAAIGHITETIHLEYEIKPLVVFCEKSKTASEFWDDGKTEKDGDVYLFAVMKRALVFDLSLLEDDLVGSDEFMRNILLNLLHITFYETGNRLPFWFECGLTQNIADNYADGGGAVADEVYSFQDYDVLGYDLFCLNRKGKHFREKFFNQSGSFVKYIADELGNGSIMKLLNNMKSFDVIFADVFKDVSGIALREMETSWREKHGHQVKSIFINDFALIKEKYFDKYVYYVENSACSGRFSVEEEQLETLEKIKNKKSFSEIFCDDNISLLFDINALGRKMDEIHLIKY